MSNKSKLLPRPVYPPPQKLNAIRWFAPEGTETPFLPDTISKKLDEAAKQLQTFYQQEEGIVYELEDLKVALTDWLENSIEQLAQDAVWHCCTGSPTYAFNRMTFAEDLKQLRKRANTYRHLD
jgi:DNA repair exonuclease SbcCD ATPase subunit